MRALLTRNAGTWQGTATALQTDIATDLPAEMAGLDPSKFSAAIRAAIPDLAAAAIDIHPPEGGGRNGRVWTIGRADAVDNAVCSVDEMPGTIIADTRRRPAWTPPAPICGPR